MKKDFFNIEDLANGKCAVVNDGTLEELRKVLGKAFPDDLAFVFGGHLYYSKSQHHLFCVDGDSETNLPTQSVKDFLHDFRVGDLVTYKHSITIYTITEVHKGKVRLEHNNGRCINVPVDNLTPYYKKGDKAEVVKDFVVLGLKKGDIIEFTDDNTIDRIGLTDEALKSMFKRIRSGKLEYDISDRLEYLKRITFNVSDPERHSHYDNKHGSLYKIAEQLRLNAYEFDILKRIARCRKKGQFKEDLQKIKDTVDLYLKEESKS